MKVAFFGTPEFATRALERLLDSSHKVVLVVTQPDKEAGRGRKITPPPTKERALEANVPVLQPKSVKTPEFLQEFQTYGADIAIVVAYGKILPKALLDSPRLGFLNIHGSLLPKYRGAAPIQWAVANGETQTGVTIMQVEEGLDSGPIVAAREVDILDDDDARSLYDMLSVLGADLLIEVLDQIEREGRIASTPQNHAEATHAPLIQREDARIDWKLSTEKLICLVRGFVMWPSAFTMLEGKEVKVLAAEAVDPSWVGTAWQHPDVLPGTVVDVVRGRGIAVRTGTGLLLVTRVKPSGKAEMDGDSFANGGGIAIGARFSGPA